MEENYLTILSKNILNDIKKLVKSNKIILEKEQEIKTDQKIIEVIKSVVLNYKDNFFETNDKKSNNHDRNELYTKIINSLAQYYVATYYDNLSLLHTLLNNGFNFDTGYFDKFYLFVLDKRISSQFDQEEYSNLLKENIEEFNEFYFSLTCSEKKYSNQEEIIKKFCNIVKKDKNIFKAKNPTMLTKRFDRFLTAEILENFSEEEILNLTDNQKRMLDRCSVYNDKEIQLIFTLIKKYNYSKDLICWTIFAKHFTIEEILELSDNDIELIKDLYCGSTQTTYDAIEKFKVIKSINKDFNMTLHAFAYSILSVEQILSMSESCCEKINILCSNFQLDHAVNGYNSQFTEKLLRSFINNAYRQDTFKRNIKKLIKIK